MSQNKQGKLKIALLQIAPAKTLSENLDKGIRSCRKAKEGGADIALFLEMWSNGYRIYERSVEEWKAEADGEEGIFMAELDLEQLCDYRRREVHGNAFQHPKKYGLLTETAIREPFVRDNDRK